MTDPITLDLVLRFRWFDEIARGRKCIEYREIKPFWTTRIWERRARIVAVRFHRGYTNTTLLCPTKRIDRGHCPHPNWPGTYYRLHFHRFVQLQLAL